MIRNVELEDAKAIASIYNHYVLNTVVTFEESAVSTEQMRQRIVEVTKEFPWFVYVEDGVILGYTYVAHWKNRSAFRFCVESTVYLHFKAMGRGLGSLLYQTLLQTLKTQNIHCVVAGITLPNPASTHLHEKLGFEQVAHFKEAGFKQNHWIDVGYWSRLLTPKPTE
jgi:L-amino acid N-acyltransferase YncA